VSSGGEQILIGVSQLRQQHFSIEHFWAILQVLAFTDKALVCWVPIGPKGSKIDPQRLNT
jgi:hypothetical protein